MKNKYLPLILLLCNIICAQTTSIPDAGFEEWLIDHNIDSDGSINGQVLTSDITGIAELDISGWDGWSPYTISDLTGIQDFTALERLVISYLEITELNISHNLQLKELRCGSNAISELDLSANSLLEVIDISTAGDVGPWNLIQNLDLSNNPNVHTVLASDCIQLEVINLRNGSNSANMIIDIGLYPGWMPDGIYNHVCIEIDNEAAAEAGQLPYSGWDIDYPYVSYQLLEDCELGRANFEEGKVSVYPNPTEGIFTVSSNSPLRKIAVYDVAGRLVCTQLGSSINEATVNISHLQPGNYIVSIIADNEAFTQKVIVNQ
ncbi:T9SS type A sorting domain-containing protein [uncultured Flavobacterium sp.]|uniref:T9SS type A sorting domain-containing protein n=1 Tax=uncultured Flavobacterium sp. TaxID=165435 RepID=UPI0025FE8BE0|nr:T9SS type A sorting domain-containing protein [uncultured Flavobacterium sp.]